jgi:hypothetical protein
MSANCKEMLIPFHSFAVRPVEILEARINIVKYELERAAVFHFMH